MRVVIYTKDDCQPCRLTKKKFDELGIPFEEESAVDAVEYIKDLGYHSAPVVEVICGDRATAHWSGYRPHLILELRATLGPSMHSPMVVVPEGP